MYKTYSDENTVVLTRNDSLCYECIKNQLAWRRAKTKTEEDTKVITNILSSKHTPGEGNSGKTG